MYGPGALLAASKKPRIRELIKSIENLTLDEIKKLPEKPDVIKGLLHIKELGTAKLTVAEQLAYKMQELHVNNIPESPSVIYKYIGEPRWIKTGKSELLLETNWHWKCMSKNEIYFSVNNICVSESVICELIISSSPITVGTIIDLKSLDKTRIEKHL